MARLFTADEVREALDEMERGLARDGNDPLAQEIYRELECYEEPKP